jgi:16S rRNA (cytidine1402-2'-O)-methyltransferase
MADKHDFYLLPNWIHPHATRQESFPESLTKVVQELEVLIAETPKEGRAFLKPFFKLIDRPVASCKVLALNEHTDSEEFEEVIEALKNGDKKAGFVSDAGLPIVADPGALLVKTLKNHHINIKAIPGPSSITHALLLSGFSGQAFAFHGYLPKLPEMMKKAIKELEYGCYENRMTQIFMERPYRNNVTFSILLETLAPTTLLCIAVELMGAKEKVITKTVEQWREKTRPDLHKKPTIFLIAAEKEDQKSMNKPRSHFIKEKRSFRGKRK